MSYWRQSLHLPLALTWRHIGRFPVSTVNQTDVCQLLEAASSVNIKHAERRVSHWLRIPPGYSATSCRLRLSRKRFSYWLRVPLLSVCSVTSRRPVLEQQVHFVHVPYWVRIPHLPVAALWFTNFSVGTVNVAVKILNRNDFASTLVVECCVTPYWPFCPLRALSVSGEIRNRSDFVFHLRLLCHVVPIKKRKKESLLIQ